MTGGLHPHWRSDADERPVRISVAGALPESAPERVMISRRPAAVAGVLLVAATVLAVYGPSALFSGQTAPAAPAAPAGGQLVIRITETGFEPATLTVRPGATVTWQNDASIPHILTSDTLQTADGLLDTSPIFPASNLAVTVAANAPEGTYDYITQTASFSGAIVVSAQAPTPGAPQQQPLQTPSSAAASAVPSPPPAQQAVSSAASAQELPVAAVSSAAPASKAPAPKKSAAAKASAAAQPRDIPIIATTAVGAIPRNPYALNRPNYAEPVQPAVSSAGSASSVRSAAPEASVTKHRPAAQPGTGPGDWAVAVMAMIALCTLFVHACRSKAWAYGD